MLNRSESERLIECLEALKFLLSETDWIKQQREDKSPFKLVEGKFQQGLTKLRELKATSLVLVEKYLPKLTGDFRKALESAENTFASMQMFFTYPSGSSESYEYFKTTLAEMRAYLESMEYEDGLISEILPELELLTTSAQQDFERSFWNNYGQYLTQYNEIVQRLHQKNLCTEVKVLQSVPENLKPIGGGFSNEEKAKLREIVNASQSLLLKLSPKSESEGKGLSALERIELICTRFHLVVRELRNRREGRLPLEIDDEYDAQYLLHALLKIYFDDVRPEEWTPTYAGGAARMDFLLKTEQLVVEVKKTRKGISAKELGEQLIVDIAKYASHGDCKTLVCFAYDPEYRIGNPRGVETDLEKLAKNIVVRVLIRPTGE